MLNINFDFNKIVGKIKPMHAVGQPPMLGAKTQHFHYLKEASIPYSRLHDVGGMFSANVYVDIPNIFRDFDANENDPESYDFTFTDHLIKALIAHGCKPIYRLGVSIENYPDIKAYRIFPPKDYAKWARICEHIIRHYNEGWANGFEFGIEYWEIWNEADGGVAEISYMWKGTKEQFYELYTVAAKHLKACFGNKIKVGGYASCGFYAITMDPKKYGMDIRDELIKPRDEKGASLITYYMDFMDGFFHYIKKENAPIDFFSWHSYSSVEVTCLMADYLERKLVEYGYPELETQCNEWNTCQHKNIGRGQSVSSANAAAMMLAFQNKPTAIMCYYDARIGPSIYGGMFNPITHEPFCTYYSFKAFGELYTLGNQVTCDLKDNNVYCIAAKDGDKKAVLITNIGEDEDISTNLCCNGMKAYIIDEEHFMTEADIPANNFNIAKNTVILFKNY